MYKRITNSYKKACNGCKVSEEKLILNLKPLVISSINKYCNVKENYDDLIQEGYEVIIKCIKDYDDSRGVYLLGYIKTTLKYYYLNRLKVINKNKAISLNQPIVDSEGTELIDIIEDKDVDILRDIILDENIKLTRTSISKLSRRQQQVILLYYFDNISQVEISNILNISYRTVVNTKKNALVKLKNILNKNFYMYYRDQEININNYN